MRLVLGQISGRGKVTLKIDQIRELQQALSLTATEARYKVAILRQFDAANTNAANAFLKTLEEPPKHVILILTASDADTLLPTITSRCRVVGLRPLPPDVIEEALISVWSVPAEQARLLAHLADGRLGWAMTAASDPAILQLREGQLGALDEALRESVVGRFSIAERLAKEPEELPDLLRTWLSWWRDVALIVHAHGAQAAVSNIDHKRWLQRIALACQSGEVLTALRKTEQALWQLDRNANTRLAVENLLLEYPLPKALAESWS